MQMETNVFDSTLCLWSEALAKQIEFYKNLGKRVYVIALSRKMPRFFDWLQNSVKDQTIKSQEVFDLCNLLNSEGVEITTEYAIPLIFGYHSNTSKNKIAGIIVDDVIIFGATLQKVSMQWWAFSGEVPYVIALSRGMEGIIASALESDYTIAMPRQDSESLEITIDTISRNIHSTSLPIDIEYPLIYSDESYEIVKRHIIQNCPSEWIYYEVKSNLYRDISESLSVLLVNSRNDGYTNDHAKIRLFKKATGCCIEMIAPSYINVLKLKDRDFFSIDEDNNNRLYTKVWQSVFDVLYIGVEDRNHIFTTIKNDLTNQATRSLLIIWTEYLYCLSAFVRNCSTFFPKESNYNIRKEDLSLILGENIANVVYDELTNIIRGKVVFKPTFDQVILQEYVSPEELRDMYFRQLAAAIKDDVPVEDNLDALYRISHFSGDICRSMNQKNLIGHHCIGESFESLVQRIEHKHIGDKDLLTEINKWVDVRIDECKLAPKYEIVTGSDNQRYFRRFFLCGSNKM